MAKRIAMNAITRYSHGKMGQYQLTQNTIEGYFKDNNVTQEEMGRAKLAAWHKGINPYPRLTMDESWTLMLLVRCGPNTEEEHETSGRLQRKACGMEDETGFTGWWRTDADPTWKFYIEGVENSTICARCGCDLNPRKVQLGNPSQMQPKCPDCRLDEEEKHHD